VALHRALDFARAHLVRQPVAAQQQRAVGLERDALQLDEIGVARSMFPRPDVAIHFVAPRMPHGLGFA